MSDLPRSKMSDLPRDMVEEEVLSRLPVTSLREVRSTCKKWNTLTKGKSFLKKHIKKKQSKGIHQVVLMLEYRVSLMSVNLLCPSVECIGNLDAGGQVDDISKIIHCDGLFLLRMTKTKDDKISSIRLVVWNPYLGQTRWIEPRNSYHKWDRYALGYEKKSKCSKVLRFVDNYDPHAEYQIREFEIYSLNSNAWKLVDVNPDWNTSFNHRGVSLKGNTYWYAQQKIPLDGPPVISDLPDFLLSFDFTTERFGPRLPLPFHGYFGDTIALSSVREEQLAVLFQKRKRGEPVKIWITSKIEPDAVSWSNLFLAVDMKPLVGFCFDRYAGSFFVDEEKNVAVVLDKDRGTSNPPTRNIAYIIGKNDYMKQVDLGESRNRFCHPLVCSYVPSSVQIEQPAPLGNVLLY